jgi:redox-sensitive bicupin YhaK (pirin superfamily)
MDHGWLDTWHTFSFASYYNPDRMHFGALRVLNDDTVQPGMGFGTHPHDNMEIISIPLEGDLEHKDSMGNSSVIKYGDIQVMSAGTGVFHSEYNKNSDKPVKFLQIWVFPDKRGVTPRYDQLTIDQDKLNNRFLQILSPDASDDGVWIHQQAWFSLGRFEKDFEIEYNFKKEGNGVYIFIISGNALVNNELLELRDGLEVTGTNKIAIKSLEKSEILLMEVPMSI